MMTGAEGLKSPPAVAANSSITEATVTAVTTAALPTRADGSSAKYILVSVNIQTWLNVGDSTVSASGLLGIYMGQDTVYVFNVAGKTHYSHRRVSADGIICISPLENQ